MENVQLKALYEEVLKHMSDNEKTLLKLSNCSKIINFSNMDQNLYLGTFTEYRYSTYKEDALARSNTNTL